MKEIILIISAILGFQYFCAIGFLVTNEFKTKKEARRYFTPFLGFFIIISNTVNSFLYFYNKLDSGEKK